MEKTNLNPTQQHDLKSNGMIINQDFENEVQTMENQNNIIIKDNKKYFISSTGKQYAMSTMSSYIEANRNIKTGDKTANKKVNHYKKLTILEKSADTLNDKITSRTLKKQSKEKQLKKAINNFDAKEALDISTEITTIDGELIILSNELQAVYDVNNKTGLLALPDYKIAFIMTLSALKTASRGRQIKIKAIVKNINGVLTAVKGNKQYSLDNAKYFKENDEVTIMRFTPPNTMAGKLLKGENGTINTEDLISDTYTAILTAIRLKILTVAENAEELPRLTPVNTDNTTEADTAINAIYNTVQNKLYEQNDKHSRKAHVTIIKTDENGEEIEDTVLYTKEVRANQMQSISAIEGESLLMEVKKTLKPTEYNLLCHMLRGKRVQRTYRTNGETVKKWVHRDYTVKELSNITNLSEMQVRTRQNDIRNNLTSVLDDWQVSINSSNPCANKLQNKAEVKALEKQQRATEKTKQTADYKKAVAEVIDKLDVYANDMTYYNSFTHNPIEYYKAVKRIKQAKQEAEAIKLYLQKA